MKKLFCFLICLLTGTLLSFCALASEPTVYIATNGNDQNTGTAAAPLKTLYAGFRALPNGGKIVMTGATHLSEATNEFPKVDGLITITSVGDKDYRNSGAGLYLSGHISIKSPVKFENIKIIPTEKLLVFLCNGYYTCFGEGIECAPGASASYPSIVGGTQGRYPANGSHVEIHSGTWLRARGGARGTGATQLGDTTFTIYGGTFTETVDLGGDSDVAGNADFYIYGGEFQAACCIASNKNIGGNVRTFLYGGNFKQGVRISRGGTIKGNCDVYVYEDFAGKVYPGDGKVSGKTTVYLAKGSKATVSGLSTTTMTAQATAEAKATDEAILQAALAEALAVSSKLAMHLRDTSAAGTTKKTAAYGDINGDGKVTLADVLLALKSKHTSYSASADITALLQHTVQRTDLKKANLLGETLSLYGGAAAKSGRIEKGFAFGTASTANYTVASEVTLQENGIVTLYFGCDNADPNGVNGYCFEVNTARGTLAGYTIRNGNYHTIGEKKLDLLADTARIYVTYIGGKAELYFDDNPLEAETYFDFNFAFPAKGNAVGVYVENATASLPVCTAASNPIGATYANNLINNFNDPEIYYENGTYYIFGGGSAGVRLFTTTDFKKFTDCGTVIQKGDAFGDKSFNAGNVIKHGDWYYLFYLAKKDGSDESVEACASSKSIAGPYTNATKKPLAAGSDIIGGQPFIDDDGTVYLLYTRTKGGNQTYGAKVILKDGQATLDRSTETFLLTVDQEWEYARACVVECGFIVKHGGLYYLIYAGGNYNSTSGVGYAISENPLGPYTKYAHNPILQSNDQSFGVGAASIFPSADGTEHFFVYLRNYSYAKVRPLQTCMDRIRFAKDPRGGADLLEIAGPSVTPQSVPSGTGSPTTIDYQTARFHW